MAGIQSAGMGGILSSMGGQQGLKHFSISSFLGTGLDQAGLFAILGDEKDVFNPMSNVGGFGEWFSNARGGAESIFKRMTDVFKDKEEAWDAATFMSENKDAIAGPNSPDWKSMAEQTPPGTPIDPNHEAFRDFKPVPSIGNDVPQNAFNQPFGSGDSGGSSSGGGGGGGGGDGAQRPGMFDAVFNGSSDFVNVAMDGGVFNVPRASLGQLSPDGSIAVGGLGKGTMLPSV